MAKNSNPSHHSAIDQEILNDFAIKREQFEAYVHENKLPFVTCSGCSYPSISSKGHYEICMICDWEDDGSDDDLDSHFNEFLELHSISGPNKIALIENRITIGHALLQLANTIGGQVSHDPKYVLDTIKKYAKKISTIYKSIPMSANISHIGWQNAKNAKLELREQLIIPKILEA